MEKLNLVVESLRVEKFREAVYSDFDDTIDNERYILNCHSEKSTVEKYEVILYEENGECFSGYTNASWGHIVAKKVNKFAGITHAIKDKNIDMSFSIPIDCLDKNNDNDITNNIFTVDYNGDDSYYPSGLVDVNMDLFKPTPRYMETRPVWIFKGDSCLGKSYLSTLVLESSELTKYETDSDKELPDELYQDIIVIGNKYNFSIDDIENKIVGEHKSIIVDFK